LWPARVEELALAGALSDQPDAGLVVRCSSTIRWLLYANVNGGYHADDAACASETAGEAPRLKLDDRPETYDAVVLCANTPSTARLLSTLPVHPGSDAFLDDLRAFEHAPIATLTLEFEQPISLPAPMLLLSEDRQRG